MRRVRGYWECAIWMQLDGYLSYKGIEPRRHLAGERGPLEPKLPFGMLATVRTRLDWRPATQIATVPPRLPS